MLLYPISLCGEVDALLAWTHMHGQQRNGHGNDRRHVTTASRGGSNARK
jgi:hypothetical protein